MLKFKPTVSFKGIFTTKANKIILKFEQTTKETEMMTALSELAVDVWKFERRRLIMVTQIDKWIEDADVLPDIIQSNSLDQTKVKLVKIINRAEFSTKRAILSMEGELLEQLRERPNGEKLKVGYRTVPFKILDDRRPNVTCHHCDQPGHRGYEKVKRSSGEEHLENSGPEWKLICRNRCSECTTSSEGSQCNKKKETSQKRATEEIATKQQ